MSSCQGELQDPSRPTQPRPLLQFAVPTIATERARIQYWKTGKGPAVVLVQGAGVIGEGWRPQIDELKDRYTVLWIDNRGIGQSVITSGQLRVEDMAADVLAVADVERLKDFHLIGHSMGGLIAQPVALTSPGDELCAGLQGLFGRDLADQPFIVMRQVRAMSTFDVSSQLSELAPIRTIVVSAEHDRIARPQYGRELAAAIPGASYTECPAAGHAVTIQQAAEVNAMLLRHLGEASPAQA